MPLLERRRHEADTGEEPKAREDCDIVRDAGVGGPGASIRECRVVECPEVLVVDPDGNLVEPCPKLAA